MDNMDFLLHTFVFWPFSQIHKKKHVTHQNTLTILKSYSGQSMLYFSKYVFTIRLRDMRYKRMKKKQPNHDL